MAILDTGSSVTIINHHFLKNIEHHTFQSIHRSYSSANCTDITIIGEVILNITLNNVLTSITAAVATHLVTDILLGADWIAQNVVSIHFDQKTLLIRNSNGDSTTVSLIRPTPSASPPVVCIPRSPVLPRSRFTHRTRVFTRSSTPHATPRSISSPFRHIHHIHAGHAQHTNHQRRLGVSSTNRIVCGTAVSPMSHSSDSTRVVSHRCYVCNLSFISNNDLYRHLRAQCYPRELRQEIETLAHHLHEPSRTQIQNILWKHAKLFDSTKPSKITVTLADAIDTGNHRPVYTAPYRRSRVDHAAIDAEVAILLREQRIEPSTSSWCSPVVLVRKKDGNARFCVDYRKLNAITKKDSFPLPRLDDIFDQLSGSRYFTKLDFKSGYFQVPLASLDRPKTAFSTRDNHYEFTVLPQGVKNGPPTFQRIVNQILGPTRWKHCIAYLDDVLIFSKTFAEHLVHLNEVLQLLADANFRLNTKKCDIATDRIDYLGHSIRHGLLRPNTDNIRGLLDTSVPTSSRETFRFLKAAEYYRKFIRNFSTIAAPLYKHAPSAQTPSPLPKTATFHLAPDEHAAFAHLKRILTGELVLRLPNFDLPFKVQTDASQIGIGAVLLQMYPEGDRPVCYMSKKLTPCQQRWPTIEQECYAIVTAITHWHHYLHGQHFILETDHRPLQALMQKSQLNSKCERWRLLLQTYDCTVKHIAGASNTMSDYLSRSPVDPPTEDSDDVIGTPHSKPTALDSSSHGVNAVVTRSRTRAMQSPTVSSLSPPSTASPSITPSDSQSSSSSAPIDDLRITFTGDLHALRVAQTSDNNIQFLIEHLTDPRFNQNYTLDNGILMHFTAHSKPVPCVPAGPLRRDIMRIYHDTPANGGHFGRDKTLRKIRDRYYWESMNTDITHYVRSCLRCSENNPLRRKPAGHLQSIAPPEGVWQMLSMDFHGPITPVSRRGNRYIISLTDILSKFVITRAVRDCTAATAARFLQEDVICKYGTPKCILTDHGSHFTATMMDNLFKRLGIVHMYSTPYHPQTNGQIERFNSTMDAKIAALSNPSRSDWDEQLPFVTMNYNTTIHSTTRVIPFELMYGRSPVLPCDSQASMVSLDTDPYYADRVRQHVTSVSQTARDNITLAHTSSKTRYDAHRSNPSYEVNDIVLVKNIHRRYKFDVRYEGPFRILRRTSPKTYVVQHVHLSNIVRTVTVDSIAPLFSRFST